MSKKERKAIITVPGYSVKLEYSGCGTHEIDIIVEFDLDYSYKNFLTRCRAMADEGLAELRAEEGDSGLSDSDVKRHPSYVSKLPSERPESASTSDQD